MKIILSPGSVYHIYNRANGSENLFREEKNYDFFLHKLEEHITPIAEIFSWCLLANHFHLMVRIRSEDIVRKNVGGAVLNEAVSFGKLCNKRFSNFFSSYAQAYNKVYQRRGNLFQANMKTKLVTHAQYHKHLLIYIHQNAVKHGFVNDFKDWPYSSWFQYTDMIQSMEKGQSVISPEIKSEVFQWFGSKEKFMQAHSLIENIRSVFE